MWGMGGGLPAAGAKILAIFSVTPCILALECATHTIKSISYLLHSFAIIGR